MEKAILLAEDSEDDEVQFRIVMKSLQVTNPVVVVRDGDEAIAYLQGEGKFADRRTYPWPEVLFLDLRMPRMDGFAVLEWLEDRPMLRRGLLVIVLSHFGELKEIRRAYDLGANSFLPKPFTQQDWENLIRHFDGHWIRAETGGRGTATLER
jgi:CheY-like chemotaxis protein